MVQYVFTPWRDRQELLLVRRQFYGEPSSTAAHGEKGPSQGHDDGSAAAGGGGGGGEQRRQQQQQQHQAVARVSMWMQRGSCPHMVESTALLMAAVLSDESAATENAGSSTYAVRAAYSAAFSRFVTGLLDGHQEKQRKQSMYSVAKTIGLPATFVELRHQATHEQLPSLAKLRSAARKALAWMWDYYWKNLVAEEEEDDDDDDGNDEDADAAARRRRRRSKGGEGGGRDACRELVLSYLREDDEAARRSALGRLRRRWELERVLRTVAELQETLPGNQVFLKCLKLSKELVAMAAEADGEGEGPTEDEEEIVATEAEEEEEEEEARSTEADDEARPGHDSPDRPSELDTGWSRYSGAWKPKPIGIA